MDGLISLNVWTLIFTWVNLIILFLVLKRFLYKPVKKMLQKREDEVKKEYEEAAVLKNEGEQLKTEYEQSLLQAKDQAGEIISNAVKKAAIYTDETEKQAKQKAADIIKKAEQEMESERNTAANQMKDEITNLSVLMAKKMLKREITDEDQSRFIDEFIEDAGELNWQE